MAAGQGRLHRGAPDFALIIGPRRMLNLQGDGPVPLRGVLSVPFRAFGIRPSRMNPNTCTICELMFATVMRARKVNHRCDRAVCRSAGLHHSLAVAIARRRPLWGICRTRKTPAGAAILQEPRNCRWGFLSIYVRGRAFLTRCDTDEEKGRRVAAAAQSGQKPENLSTCPRHMSPHKNGGGQTAMRHPKRSVVNKSLMGFIANSRISLDQPNERRK